VARDRVSPVRSIDRRERDDPSPPLPQTTGAAIDAILTDYRSAPSRNGGIGNVLSRETSARGSQCHVTRALMQRATQASPLRAVGAHAPAALRRLLRRGDALHGDGVVVPPELERRKVLVAQRQVGDGTAILSRCTSHDGGRVPARCAARHRPPALARRHRRLAHRHRRTAVGCGNGAREALAAHDDRSERTLTDQSQLHPVRTGFEGSATFLARARSCSGYMKGRLRHRCGSGLA
jgi:hypothetical protein